MTADNYLTPEARARVNIDRMLKAFRLMSQWEPAHRERWELLEEEFDASS